MKPQDQRELADLFRRTASDFESGRIGDDNGEPDWPIGYAEVLRQPLAERYDLEFSRSGLISCLLKADDEYEARSPDSDWADFYAGYLAECHGASETPDEDRLALYYFPSCPFCRRVLAALEPLDVDVELRNINEDDRYREELIEARGRGTVPVLRIESPDGEIRWMPESKDIVRYLRKTYA